MSSEDVVNENESVITITITIVSVSVSEVVIEAVKGEISVEFRSEETILSSGLEKEDEDEGKIFEIYILVSV